MDDRDARQAARDEILRLGTREMSAVLSERVTTERPFVERLVAFWSNHLCVSTAADVSVFAFAGRYEREVIRPHLFGRFEDMVLASARHPAMLVYLDNMRSVGPNSRVGRQTARRGTARGLNENYARELLELHTLGVDGGYAQSDVESLARVLTGWTLQRAARGTGSPEFAFRPELHEPGPKQVLGRTYQESGRAEGESVIRDLCRHPSTARFVSEKLVRHLVADRPPFALVDRVASVFLDTGGDLRAVTRSLVTSPETWETTSRKFRTPQDWLVAALRALDASLFPPSLIRVLRELQHLPWAPDSPQGYGDTQADWADPDALMNRAELARTVADHVADRLSAPSDLLGAMEVRSASPLPQLLRDERINRVERAALAVGGPSFQWR